MFYSNKEHHKKSNEKRAKSRTHNKTREQTRQANRSTFKSIYPQALQETEQGFLVDKEQLQRALRWGQKTAK